MTATTARNRMLGHVITAEQFDRELLDLLFLRATALADVRDDRLAHRVMATLFYEPSTRTRLSFESAMLRLGGAVIGTEAARTFSSAIKGETLEDTVRMVSTYADLIVLRHDEAGAAARAASVASVPVVNAGDGPGEHPTQALLDLYTIERELGHVDGVSVAFCGDLRFGRTARSLALLLALYPGSSPLLRRSDGDPGRWRHPRPSRGAWRRVPARRPAHRRASTTSTSSTRRASRRSDSPTRSSTSRPGRRSASTAPTMRQLPANAIVMHPLPRVDEIAPEVDADPRAAYFRQAANGVAIRMALLEMLLA